MLHPVGHRLNGLQLVLQALAPVIARMLGYNDDHTTRIAEEAGGTWRHYAPGAHRR